MRCSHKISANQEFRENRPSKSNTSHKVVNAIVSLFYIFDPIWLNLFTGDGHIGLRNCESFRGYRRNGSNTVGVSTYRDTVERLGTVRQPAMSLTEYNCGTFQKLAFGFNTTIEQKM